MERLPLHTNIHRHKRIQPLRRGLWHILLRHRLWRPTAHTHLSKLLRHARHTTTLLRVARRWRLIPSLGAIGRLLPVRGLSLSIRVHVARLWLTVGRLLRHAVSRLLWCLLARVAICGRGGRCLTAYTWRRGAALGSIRTLAEFVGLAGIPSLLLCGSSCRSSGGVLLVVAAVFGVLLAVLVGVRHGCGEVGAPGSGEALLADGT